MLKVFSQNSKIVRGFRVWLCAIFFMAFCKTDPAQRRKIIGLAKKNLEIRWFIAEKNISEVRYFRRFEKTTKSLKFMKIRKFYYVESYSKLYSVLSSRFPNSFLMIFGAKTMFLRLFWEVWDSFTCLYPNVRSLELV